VIRRAVCFAMNINIPIALFFLLPVLLTLTVWIGYCRQSGIIRSNVLPDKLWSDTLMHITIALFGSVVQSIKHRLAVCQCVCRISLNASADITTPSADVE